jgi:hypothetical protein
MVIKGDWYELTPVNEHSTQFDLKLLYKIKGTNERYEFKDVGYGLSLDTAMKKCIQYGLTQKFEIITLKDYLKEWRKMQKELELVLHQ